MRKLADVIRGCLDVEEAVSTTDTRVLGYVATLAKGSVPDPDAKLKDLVSACRARLDTSEAPVVDAWDVVQARWGSPWHFDAPKIRKELPLYLMKPTHSRAR